jgi:cytochrome b561
MEIPMKYTLTMRLLHWLLALALFGMIASGYIMTGLSDDVSYKWTVYGLHKAFGFTLFFLTILRLAIRWRSLIPPLPSSFSKLMAFLTHQGHSLLYLLMLAVPASGYFASLWSGYPVAWFGINVSLPLVKNEAIGKLLGDAHGILPYVLLAVIGLHIAAVLKHRYLDRQDILYRMM